MNETLEEEEEEKKMRNKLRWGYTRNSIGLLKVSLLQVSE